MDDPRKVGGRYYSGYWGQEYDVTAMREHNGSQWFTCAWADGTTTTHCTAWDEWRDKVVSSPVTGVTA